MPNCRSCNALIQWARTPPTGRTPEGALTPLALADVYWPVGVTEIPAERDRLPPGLSSRRTHVYEVDRVTGRAYSLGQFYIVRDASAIDMRDISRRLVSHFANCPNAAQHSRRI